MITIAELNAISQLNAMFYVAPVMVIWSLFLGLKGKKQRKYRAVREAAIKSGMTEPPSLHPVINPNRCIGCGSCVRACPEQAGHEVLGIIADKSHLIGPSYCIGHGACKKACPRDAITLVFGTEKRGIDIPVISPGFESNVPGLFIAGELGGMGLIRNAIEQGRQAMASIAKLDGIGQGSQLDVLIVGAGPAGFSASLAAMEHKLRHVTVEQDELGGAVAHFPRGKVVMTAPVNMPMVGKVKMKETTKEKLLEFWKTLEQQTGVKINYQERMETINRTAEGFEVKTDRGTYLTRAVLLAIGRRGTPRKLNVCGEDNCKVVYSLRDPEQYRGQRVLVVGGGDSALEAATSIAEEPETSVAIAYRSGAFGRAKEKNREKIEEAEAAGRLKVFFKSNVKAITATHIQLDRDGNLMDMENDAVIICAGGVLPTPFLKKTGITVETKHGKP